MLILKLKSDEKDICLKRESIILDDVIEMSRPVKMNSLLKLYFDKNILTPQKLLNYLKVDEVFLNHLAGINLKLFKDYVNENREYNITNLYK